MPNFGYISADTYADWRAEYGWEEDEEVNKTYDDTEYWEDEY